MDAADLLSWVRSVRSLLRDAHRLEAGDQQIGNMLSASLAEADGSWPCAAVRAIIESERSVQLERGFSIGLYNRRGVVTRSPGGAQERSLAERYEGFASAVADTAPRTAAVLRGIGRSYRDEAAREDLQSAVEQDLEE